MLRSSCLRLRRRMATGMDTLGPGTAGHTTSGAAYRGHEVAANTGAPHPAEPGLQPTAFADVDDETAVRLEREV